MRLFLIVLVALAVAPSAAAAPPPNDNRADAILLPEFPSNVHGTTAEATVERLDPQVSRCGRIESTVWYAIEAAPDGTIVATLQAAAGLAPVLRIYRRNSSNIEELDCARADAGGKAVVSVQAVRGAGYLILVGRRPGTGDGEFDLRADLFLPPTNDEPENAIPLGTPPAQVRSTTLGATANSTDGCGLSGGTVWYSFRGPASGRVLLHIDAADELDAIVGVFRPVTSTMRASSPATRGVRTTHDQVACARTDARGSALVSFAMKARATYLIGVGEQLNSAPGDFRLQLRAAQAPERGAGRALPSRGVRGSVNGATDVNDIWSAHLRRGTTYRIAFTSSPCALATFRARNKQLRLGCRSYLLFTPGRDGGGRYRIEIVASQSPEPHRYRLHVVTATPDDIGVGIEMRRNSTRRARLSPSGADVLDLYHFDVARLSEARLRLAQTRSRSYTLVLLDDRGARISSGSPVRKRLGPGRYVVAVQAPVGGSSGTYRLSLRLRDVTTASVRVSGGTSAEVSPGSTVSISCVVSPASGGRVELQVDRFDPLTGWHFHHVRRVAAGASVSWRPPTAGRWRVRATFLGTAGAARSRSGYAHILVAKPIR